MSRPGGRGSRVQLIGRTGARSMKGRRQLSKFSTGDGSTREVSNAGPPTASEALFLVSSRFRPSWVWRERRPVAGVSGRFRFCFPVWCFAHGSSSRRERGSRWHEACSWAARFTRSTQRSLTNMTQALNWSSPVDSANTPSGQPEARLPVDGPAPGRQALINGLWDCAVACGERAANTEGRVDIARATPVAAVVCRLAADLLRRESPAATWVLPAVELACEAVMTSGSRELESGSLVCVQHCSVIRDAVRRAPDSSHFLGELDGEI